MDVFLSKRSGLLEAVSVDMSLLLFFTSGNNFTTFVLPLVWTTVDCVCCLHCCSIDVRISYSLWLYVAFCLCVYDFVLVKHTSVYM